MIHAVVDVLISRRSGGRLNCLAGVGGEDGRGRAENYLELLSNQSRSGSVSSVCIAIIIIMITIISKLDIAIIITILESPHPPPQKNKQKKNGDN